VNRGKDSSEIVLKTVSVTGVAGVDFPHPVSADSLIRIAGG
jgi:hypothetical protein